MTTFLSRFSSSLMPGLLLAGALLAALAGTGCGSDEDSCSSVASKICQEACDCGGAAGCSIGDENGAITFDSKSDCLSLYSLACSQPAPPGTDFGACSDALDSPMCVQTSGGGMALKTPAACDDE